MRKEELRNILDSGWTARRGAQALRNAKNSERTKAWKARRALVEQVEAQLGRPLTVKEFRTLTKKRKNEMK